MATANSIDEIFNTEVDESKFNAVLGSLESQLASPSIRQQSHGIIASSINTNHVGTPKHSDAHSNSPSPQTSVDAKLFQNRGTVQASVTGVNGNKNMIGDVNYSSINSVVTTVGRQYLEKVVHSHTNTLVNNPHVIQTSAITVKNEPNMVSKSVIPRSHGQLNSSPVLRHSPGPSAIRFQSGIIEPKPVFVSSADIKPNIRTQGDVKTQQVVVNVVNTGSVQNPQVLIKSERKPPIKQEIKQEYNPHFSMTSQSPVTHSHSPVNVISSAYKTNTFTPTSTSVVTIQRPMASPPAMAVVRPAVSNPYTTIPSSGLHNLVQVPAMNTRMAMAATNPNITRTIAPRLTGAPVRIAPQHAQVQMLQQVRQGHPNSITLPQGMQLPQGAMLVKNPDGQLVVVQNNQQANQKLQTVRPGTPMPSSVHHQIRQQPVVTGARPQLPVSTGARPQLPVSIGARPQLPVSTGARPQLPVSTGARPQLPVSTGARPQLPVSTAPVHLQSPIGQPQPAPGAVQNKETVFDSMKKCKNFLQTLIKLATNQPKNTVENVKRLIQELIDGHIEPESFTQKLQVELHSSPQPYLVPFLKKSLPMLRLFLIQNKTRIEGVRPPPEDVMRRHPIPNLSPGALGYPSPSPTPSTTPIHSIQTTVAKPAVRHFTQTHSGLRLPNQHINTTAIPATQTKALLTRAPGITAASLTSINSKASFTTSSTSINSKALFTSSRTPELHPSTPLHQPHKEKRKFDSSLKDGDDDINDVATMGGVNLSEESRNILASSSEIVSGQMRSCKDETFLSTQPLMAKINAIARRHGMDACPPEIANVISHATQERLRNLLEKLSVNAEHRLEIYRTDKKYEVVKDQRSQLKFLEELDQMEKKRQDEVEREVLLRAAKSRSKNEDPEQLKLKEKAKALQHAEMEEMRQREANLTALMAIGPRKKRKTDSEIPGSSASTPGAATGSSSRSNVTSRPRTKRVNLRDLMFLLEQERETQKSPLLYKSYLK